MEKSSILIVEDEAIVALHLRQLLQSRGYHVMGVAGSGEEALVLIEESRPDLILMDITLSGSMDGIETVERIREHHDIPVVYITGNPVEQSLSRLKVTAPHGYIVKPLLAGEVTATVEIALFRHAMELKLKQSEERYRLVADNMLDLIALCNAEMRFTFVSPSYEKVLGYTPAELLGRPIVALVHEDDLPMVMDIIADRTMSREPVTAVYRMRNKKGRSLWFETRGAMLFNETGTPTGGIFNTRDITDRKAAEERAATIQAFLDSAVEQSPAGILIADAPDGTIRVANTAAMDLMGEKIENLAGIPLEKRAWPWQAFDPHGTRFGSRDLPLSRAVLHGETSRNVDIVIRRPDGRERWVLANAAPVRDESGGIIAGVVVFTDITERRRAEEEIRESRRRLHDIIQFLPVATFAVDMSGKVIAWNRAIEEMTGIKAENMAGKGDYEYALPFYGKRRPVLIDIVRGHDKEMQKEYNNIDWVGDSVFAWTEIDFPSGRHAYLWGKASPLYDAEGKIAGAIESIRDISESKKGERALRESEERYRAIVEASPNAVMLMDTDFKIIYASNHAAALYGFESPVDMAGLDSRAFVVRDNIPLIREKMRVLFRSGSISNEEFTLVKKDGTSFYGEVSAAVIRDGAGKPMSLLVISGDITERKLAQEKILLSEEKFSKAFMSSPMVVFIISLENNRFIEINDRFADLSGYTKDEVIGSTPKEIDLYAVPGEETRLAQIIESEGKLVDYEILVRKKDGSIRQGMLSGDRISIEGKRCFIGIMVDVTEMKELQKEISTVIEEERQRIGRDLHDDLGQNLAGVTMLLQSLKGDLQESGHPAAAAVENIEELVRGAAARTRDIARMLSPVEMDKTGLLSALEEMARQVEKVFVVNCRVRSDEAIEVQNTLAATNLYYITREAVNNALKHSGANSIEIALSEKNGFLTLEVQDDGKGLGRAQNGEGLGMRIMRYRAGLIGAQIEFGSDARMGFSVKVELRTG